MKDQKTNTSVVVSFIIVAAVVALGVYAFMHKSSEMEEKTAPITENVTINPNTTNPNEVSGKAEVKKGQPTSLKNMEPNAKILANFTPIATVTELKKIDTVVGTGKEAQAGDTVSVHYVGAIASSGLIFQSSKDFGPTPVTFPLTQVIKGWTNGIPGMKIGGTRRLIIPADQAYGATPPPGSGIQPNAALVFDVELVGIK